MILLPILWKVILPVFLIIALGYLLERRLSLDVRPISRVTFYALTPCLVFSSTAKSSVGGVGIWKIVSFTLLTTLTIGLFSWAVARALRFSRAMESAFLLTTVFVNAGNYGLPVNLFAFGQAGLERAALFFTVSALLTHSVGVYLASRGQASRLDALRNVFKVPVVYGVSAGFVVNLAAMTVPEPVAKVVDLLGRASVPLMLLLVGIQLAKTSLAGELKLIGLATFVRLVVAPAVAFILAAWLGLMGVTRQACVTEASMPTAVTTTILATEFEAEPQFVAGVVFVSTLASVITLTLSLALIM
ncbi:MAG: AEC family transporter [Anaerolineales bacterium]|nr:MAG: AEC family transporter [Anaerolineales bacterium]